VDQLIPQGAIGRPTIEQGLTVPEDICVQARATTMTEGSMYALNTDLDSVNRSGAAQRLFLARAEDSVAECNDR